MAAEAEGARVQDRPTVSVVVAAYNRSNVLRHALRSVLAQDFADFELLVIGDACTDDSEEVATSFGDPRVIFENLPLNFGEQAGPNNVGIARSRGRYVAFLNQDDMWFPDHLSVAVEWLEATGSDMVHTLGARIVEVGPDGWRAGLAPDGGATHFDPLLSLAPASSWLVKRGVFDRIGVMRPARECRIEPTQEFLFRAWRAGVTHRIVPQLTHVVLPSDTRQNSYAERHDRLHDRVNSLMVSRPQWREEVLQQIWAQPETRWTRVRDRLRRAVLLPFALAGFPPRMLRVRQLVGLAALQRGGRIDDLRAIRGLDPLMRFRSRIGELRVRALLGRPPYRLGTEISFGKDVDQGIKEDGWSYADAGGTWTEGKLATVCFPLARDHRPRPLQLTIKLITPEARPLQRLELRAGDVPLGAFKIAGSEEIAVTVPPEVQKPGRLLRIWMKLPDAAPTATDHRRLSLFVRWMRLSGAEPAPSQAEREEAPERPAVTQAASMRRSGSA